MRSFLAVLVVLISTTMTTTTGARAAVVCIDEMAAYVRAEPAFVVKTRLGLMTCLARAQARDAALLEGVAASGPASEKSFLLVDTDPAAFSVVPVLEDSEGAGGGLADPDAGGVMYSCRCPGAGTGGYGLALPNTQRLRVPQQNGVATQPLRVPNALQIQRFQLREAR